MTPWKLRTLDEIMKGLNGFIEEWRGMAHDDLFGRFNRQNDLLKDYWKDVASALDLHSTHKKGYKMDFGRIQGFSMMKLIAHCKKRMPTMNLLLDVDFIADVASALSLFSVVLIGLFGNVTAS